MRRARFLLFILPAVAVILLGILAAGCGDDEPDVQTNTPTARTPLVCGMGVKQASEYDLTSTLTLKNGEGKASFANVGDKPFTYTTAGTTPAVAVDGDKVTSAFGASDRMVTAGTIRPGQTVTFDVAASTVSCDDEPLHGRHTFAAVLYHTDDVPVLVASTTAPVGLP